MTATSQNPDRPTLRKRIDALLLTDAELETFCLDYFPSTQSQFGRGMTRTEKVNLLLQQEDLASLADKLRVFSEQPPNMPESRVDSPWVSMGSRYGRAGLVMLMVAVGLLGWALNSGRGGHASEPAPRAEPATDPKTPQDALSPQRTSWEIAGLVRGPQNALLSGIRVSLPSLGLSTTTNAYGHFVLNGTDELSVQSVAVLLRAESPGTAKPLYRPREQHVYRGSTELVLHLEKGQ